MLSPAESPTPSRSATPAPARITPKPDARTPIVIGEPPPAGGSLQEFARRIRQTPKDQRPRGTFTYSGGDAARLVSYRQEVVGNAVVVSGIVENQKGREIWVFINITARRPDGTEVSELFETERNEPIPAYGRAGFRATLNAVLPDTVKFQGMSYHDLGGTIETADQKAQLEAIRRCLAFRALVPNPPELSSRSVEVRANNKCSMTLSSTNLWFRVTVRDVSGNLISRQFDHFPEDLPAGKEARRVVQIAVPVGAVVDVNHYAPGR